MPRFYFHSTTDALARDDEGFELANSSAAIERAAFEIRVMAADEIMTHGTLNLGHRIEVSDADGTVVTSLCIGEIVTVSGTTND